MVLSCVNLMCQLWHRDDRGFQAGSQPAATANQNVTINIPHKKPEQWLPCVPHKLQHSNGAKGWLILNKILNINNDTFNDNGKYTLQSNEANDTHLKAGIRPQSLCIPPVNTASRNGRIEKLRRNRRSFELNTQPSIMSVTQSESE